MSEGTPRIERFLERAAGLASGTSLHPVAILNAALEAAETSVSDGMIANAYTVSMAPADAEFFSRNASQIKGSLVAGLADLARSRRLRLPAPWVVELEARNSMDAGSVRVEAAFRNLSPPGAAVPDGRTQAIRRLKGVFIDVGGSGRFAVTHTPFVIGRGPECDLPVFDLAMSRKHAVIDSLSNGVLVVRDLGSRNGVTVDGVRMGEAALGGGAEFVLGGTTFRMEMPE